MRTSRAEPEVPSVTLTKEIDSQREQESAKVHHQNRSFGNVHSVEVLVGLRRPAIGVSNSQRTRANSAVHDEALHTNSQQVGFLGVEQ